MSDYDQRQLALMRQQLEQYRSGKLGLGLLIENLEALLNVLQDINEEWKGAFHQEWFNLEQIFAVAVDRPEENVIGENSDTLELAVTNLERLVSEQLNEELQGARSELSSDGDTRKRSRDEHTDGGDDW